MGTTTTTFALNKPTVGGDDNAWGTDLNANADKLDDLLDGTTAIKPNLDVGLWKVGGTAVTSTAAELNILDGANATIATALLANPQRYLDPENRIINGAMDFWQRGTSFTAFVYGADRWINGNSGGTVTMSRQSFANGDTLGSNNPTFFMRQTVSGQTLASHYAQIAQHIEGVRSYAGQTITVLGWARRSSGSGNVAVNWDQSFGTGGSPSTPTTGTAQTLSLTGSWAPFAFTFSIPSITGKTLGSSGNDFLRVVFWTSAGSDYNVSTGSLGLQTIGVDLWGIHIKLGTHTTAATDLYKAPELGPEFDRCLRYYEITSYRMQQSPNVYATGYWKVQKRATPALGISGTGAISVASADPRGAFVLTTFATATYDATVTGDAEL